MGLKRLGEYYLGPLSSVPILTLLFVTVMVALCWTWQEAVNLVTSGGPITVSWVYLKPKHSYCLSECFFHISCLSLQVRSQEGSREAALAFYLLASLQL